MISTQMSHALHERGNEVLALLEPAGELYYRLILVAGRGRSGKTTVLRNVAEATGGAWLDVGLELSKGLLTVEPHQVPLKAPLLVSDLVLNAAQRPVLIDNTDILFDKLLGVDPLVLLQKAARSRTIVAAWRGYLERGRLHYSQPARHDARSYSAHDLLIVDLNPGMIS